MLFIGSVCAIIASGFMYRNFRESWPLALENFWCEIKYALLASKDLLYAWINRKMNKNDCPPQSGRIAIVTGGSRGIGFEVVQMLLELDMEVIIACRTPSAGEKAISKIRESGITTGEAKVYKLDNASLESVRQFAADIKKDYKQIHVLINNAGIMFGPYQETEDGFEQQWAVNYLSHFLLTALLLPLLKAGGTSQKSARIVNVSSCVQFLGKINFNDINNRKRFVTGYAYAQSKLAQEIFTKGLQNLLNEKEYYVQVYSVHPGVVFTELFVHSYVWKYKYLFQPFFKTPRQGAISVAYAALNKDIENNGGIYIEDCCPSPCNPHALDVSMQKKLYDLSLQQVKLNDFFQYV